MEEGRLYGEGRAARLDLTRLGDNNNVIQSHMHDSLRSRKLN